MRRTGNAAPSSWWPDLALFAGFGLLTGLLAVGALLDLDVAARDWALTHRPEPLRLLARGLNHLGSARLMAAICLTIAVPLGVRTRSIRPLLPVITAYTLSYLFIGPIKIFSDRAAPLTRNPDGAGFATDAVQLFTHANGMSYPSGHVINTFIWYQVLALLLHAWFSTGLSARIRRPLRTIPPVVVSLTVVYLAFHWLTDVMAALPLGLILDRSMRRLPWGLEREGLLEMDTCRSDR